MLVTADDADTVAQIVRDGRRVDQRASAAMEDHTPIVVDDVEAAQGSLVGIDKDAGIAP